MSISERQQQILKLLEERAFCTVQQLSEITYISTSSIRRDLSILQNRGLIHRTHGGAALCSPGDKVATLQDRLTKGVPQKRMIAKKASVFLQDGQSILLDGSSTAGFLLPYIAQRKDVSLFTNSMVTAIRAIELGIPTNCLGGRCVKNSPVLSGEAAYEAVSKLRVDILFFSSQYLDENGVISDSTEEENFLRRLMIRNAAQSIFLCDSDKFGYRALYELERLNRIDAAVFDKPFPALKTTCKVVD